MSGGNPELQARLRELDHELEEGDITEKGYQKRRTRIISQFLGSTQSEPMQSALRIHSPEDTIHPINDGSRGASLGALNSRSSAGVTPAQYLARSDTGAASSRGETLVDSDSRGSTPGPDYPLGQVGRFQEREMGGRPAANRQSSYSRDPPANSPRGQEGIGHSREMSGGSSAEYAFNPNMQGGYGDQSGAYGSPGEGQSRQGTMLDSHQGFFSDFAGQQSYDHSGRDSTYGGPAHRYSSGDTFSPTAGMAPPMLNSSDLPPPGAINHMMPLEPRDFTFAVYDPHNGNIPMSKFDNIATVLRHRSRTNAKQPAYMVLDQRGKETAQITWEKLGSRAEKVAHVIRDKSNLYRGDRVALVYRDAEIIDFAVALLGCFIAGVVAVPINNMEDYPKLNLILTSTQAHLALTTDSNLRTFQRDIAAQKLNWPRGVEWWKTNEFGSFHPKKKDDIPPLQVPDIAYIEFSKAPTGDLRGVVMSHRTIMHQMACLSAIISTVPTNESNTDTFYTGLRDKSGKLMSGGGAGEIIISYLDPRQSIGLIFAVLLTVYGGHTTVWAETRAVTTPGLYANLITRYKATLMLADYPGLKTVAYNYQNEPMVTRNFRKNFEPNISSVKLCLIDTLTVDSQFHEILADRWLRPMRNPRARELVAPMLCLPEHGGMVICMRDWLGGEERMGCPLKIEPEEEQQPADETKDDKADVGRNGYGSLIGQTIDRPQESKDRTELGEVLLDKEALKTNEVIIVAMGEEARKRAGNDSGTVRVGGFGYPIPDATLAVVDPETRFLCVPNVVGEIWVDSPSLSGGFWNLPKHTETIFHAKPYKLEEGNPTPMSVEPEFLRTGLLGCVIEGKIFVLGLYEDRLRQKVEWVEHGIEVAEYRYFFVQHLIVSIMKNIPKIYDCSAFDVYVNDEHLPIVLLESPAASTSPQTSGGPPRQLDTALLDSISERCMEVLMQEHQLRVYCVMITAPSTLPRIWKNGRYEIGNILCRKEFDSGSLPCVHVKFGVERAVLNLPVGIDPVGGIWSAASTQERQDILVGQDKQYSGVDFREVVIDDRTSTPLNNFSSIVDLLQWRVARQAEELSYCTIDSRVREGKYVSWKKFDTKVAAVAMYLKNKAKVKAGDRLILMYTHSEDFVYAVHACFCLGVVVIPQAPLDQNRLHEDVPAFLHMISDFRVKAILVNNEVDHLLRVKAVSQHLKQSASVLKTALPSTYNTSKPPKQTSGCRDLGFTLNPAWIDPQYPVLVLTYWTPDQRRIAVQLGHNAIMGTCKVQKETCQMSSSRPILGCVRSTIGLGFLHTCLMGVFVGAPTYLVSPVDFAQNPLTLFLTLARYKIKDTYATSQMLDHAMRTMPGKGFQLHELKNLMISTEGRPRVDVYQKVRLHFAAAGLDRTAINTIYSHPLNPMIASRSYMCIEPIELWLDARALRRGLVFPVDPDTDPSALLVQDSGMVPVSTRIAIVNPETCRLCHVGEYGEIWVESEACVTSFYASRDRFDAERFNGKLEGNAHVSYVRTGDLGFLHSVSRPIGPGGAQLDMQILFVLGAIGETFEVNGLSHFPMDIEFSVEKCHRNIVPGGCAVFQAGGLVVVLVEVLRKAYLASIVPVIVNAILNEHQLIVDIVAFVANGDFPRSRLGEKQRGKILASWVTRKMRPIAQFGIRDPDNASAQANEASDSLTHRGAARNGSVHGSNRRDSENPNAFIEPTQEVQQQYTSLPVGISEMPTHDTSSMASYHIESGAVQGDETPTATKSQYVDHYELPEHNYYSPVEPGRSSPTEISSGMYLHSHTDNETLVPDGSQHPSARPRSPPIRLNAPNIPINETPAKGDLWSLPSQKPRRVVNSAPGDTDEWSQDALMHMNLAGENMNLAADTNRLSYSRTPPPPPPHPPGWAS